MNIEYLASELRRTCETAPNGEKVVRIHLFGIRHAEHLDGKNLHDLAERAGIRRSFGTELRKGVRLSEYVLIKA